MSIECPKCQTNNSDSQKFCGECATPLPGIQEAIHTKTLETPTEELTTGSTFAQRYQIIEELGRGGMGRVYKALDKETKERIALKLIKPEISSDNKTIERFRSELTSARKISHRNVCRMYDLNKENGNYYITMEYVEGENLTNMITMSGQLGIGTAISIAKQICKGLTEAHKQGVVHRDLKPGNIMIDREGEVRIMDFGIARSLKDKGITDTGVMIGTPEYMSPEQVEGGDIDQQSDIYSLGVILYKMVTGKVPFGGDTALSIAMKQKTEEPKDPREFNLQLSEDLVRIILKCLAKDRRQRCHGAGEVLSELNKIEERITTSEKVLPKEKPEKRLPRRLKPILLAGSFMVTAVIVALVFIILPGILKRGPAEKEILTDQIWQHKIVVFPFENLGLPDDQYFAAGVTEEITSRLASVHELGVISRQTAIQYDRTGKTVRQIGDDLGVDFILGGTVRWDRETQEKSNILVTPQLIRASDDTHVWSNRYSRILDDIFTVQSEIAEQVIRNIDSTLLNTYQSSQQGKPTENLEAYDLYLRGIKASQIAPLKEDFEEALKMLEQAVVLDPGFALAYTKLSWIHSFMYLQGYDRTEDRQKKAMEASKKALELEPDLADAHFSLGAYYYLCNKDYDKALEKFSTVEKSKPNDVGVLSYVGYILRRQGHFDKSLDNLNKALKLNPLNIGFINNQAYSYQLLRKYGEADNYYRRSISLAPDQQTAYQELVYNCLLWKGDFEEAKRIIEKMPKDENPETFWYWIELDLLERNYQKALDRIASTSLKTVMFQRIYMPIEQYTGFVYFLMNKSEQSRINYNLAQVFLEEKIREQPDDPRLHSSLGIVYAMIGRKEDAIREGKIGIDLLPISKDALMGPDSVYLLAQIYTILGMHDEAIDQLEYLLSIPCLLSVTWLKLHPEWDRLREHPRFKSLLEKYSKDN